MKFLAALLFAGPVFAQTPLTLTLPEAEALAVKQHPQLAGARLSTAAAEQVVREVNDQNTVGYDHAGHHDDTEQGLNVERGSGHGECDYHAGQSGRNR